jgi:TonB-dependent receptor
LLCTAVSVPSRASEAPRKAYDLPADAAEKSLKRFAVQSGVEVLFTSETVRGVRTQEVRGEFAALEAVQRALAGTKLIATLHAESGAFVISRAEPGPMPPPAEKKEAVPAATANPVAGTGILVGRVYNPATGEFVRNAEIAIKGTELASASAADGHYVLARVPAGEVVVTVSYTGYLTATATVFVAADATVNRDFELVSAFVAPGAKDEILKLAAFTVSSEREGNAKAIMEQRNSMNITNSVASDVFGDNAEGNVGDFLRNMPGVDLELTQGEVRNVRLRGLGSEYNSVTIDGVSLASADANKGAAGDARGFSFEQVSLSSMDSIEVSKTISADVDANAPAGTINLKSKRAFSRAGRRITVQANIMAFADEFNLRKSYGPDDARHRKILPGGIVEYSDVFFDKRLGVVLSVSESNLYSENARSTVSYNYTPTAADPRPAVPTSLSFLHAPRLNRRSTTTLTTDFKATSHLVLSLSLVYNYASLYNLQRSETFNAGNRALVVGATPLTSFTSAATGSVTSAPSVVVKPGETYTAVPKFEYRRGNLLVEGRFAGSDSKSWYNPLARQGSVQSAGNPALPGVTFTAERSSLSSGDWKVKQVAGPDFGLGDGYTNPTLVANDGRYGRTQVYSGDITATLNTSKFLPITWKAGVKRKLEIRDFLLDSESKRYTYTGPGAGPGVWKDINSPFAYDLDAMGASLVSTSGRNVFIPNLLEIGKLFQERPEYFTQSLTTTNYYNAYIGNTRHFEEQITAGFLMGTTNLGKAILRAGLRWEDTATDAREFDPRSATELAARGFPETNGVATTIPGLQYQFFSKPKIHRVGGYDNLFPSASVKYKFTRNLDFHLGYSTTIRRPTIRDVAGVWVIDDDNLTVTAPNPSLKPETSRNYAARLAYYFEPIGIVGANFFQNTVRGLHRSVRETAAEFGYKGDLDLSNYEFRTTVASAAEVAVRGMELEYSQSLSFLPRPFKGLNARASYTRTYSDVITPNMAPHGASFGLSYSLSRFSIYANTNWRADVPTTTDATLFNRHRATIDLGGGVRLTNRFSLFFTGRNVANVPVITMQRIGANPAVAQTYEITSSIWTFGLKGVF